MKALREIGEDVGDNLAAPAVGADDLRNDDPLSGGGRLRPIRRMNGRLRSIRREEFQKTGELKSLWIRGV